MKKFKDLKKVITGIVCFSYLIVNEPKSINGGTPKYSASLIIPKSDKITLGKIETAIQAAYDEGQSIVAHIHDEVILECRPDVSLDVICEQMSRVPDWAKGLLLRADGYECEFYKKD